MKFGFLMRTITISAAILLAVLLSAACEDREPQELSFAMNIEGGQLTGESLVAVNQDDTVTLDWTSDLPVLVHLHGYDIELALQPGVSQPMTLVADATGRFNITVHSIDSVHLHASGESCRASVSEGQPQPSVSIAAAESRTEGNVFIEVDVENLVIEPGGGHWCLTMDGVDYGMYSRSSVTLPVDGAGERVLKATLADANHCLFEASDSATVRIDGDAPMEDGSMNMTVTPMTNDNVGTVSSGGASIAMSGTPDPTYSLSMDGTPMAHMSGTLEATPTPHDMSSMDDTPSAAGIPERVIATLEVRP